MVQPAEVRGGRSTEQRWDQAGRPHHASRHAAIGPETGWAGIEEGQGSREGHSFGVADGVAFSTAC